MRRAMIAVALTAAAMTACTGPQIKEAATALSSGLVSSAVDHVTGQTKRDVDRCKADTPSNSLTPGHCSPSAVAQRRQFQDQRDLTLRAAEERRDRWLPDDFATASYAGPLPDVEIGRCERTAWQESAPSDFPDRTLSIYDVESGLVLN